MGAQPPLLEFNQIGVLSSADVHVAERIARLTGESDPAVIARGGARRPRTPARPRVRRPGDDRRDRDRRVRGAGRSQPAAVAGGGGVGAGRALQRAACAAAAEAEAERGRGRGGSLAPLRLEGSRLYLDRYWQRGAPGRRGPRRAQRRRRLRTSIWRPLAAGLERLFPPGSDVRQRAAAAAAVIRRFAVVAGGPGTGKTTTVARIVALLGEQAAATGRPPLVALAAPTGKAAARLAGGGPRRGGDARRRAKRSARCCSACAPRRCIGCSAGGRGATAGSPTIARTACRTTS